MNDYDFVNHQIAQLLASFDSLNRTALIRCLEECMSMIEHLMEPVGDDENPAVYKYGL